VELDPPGRGLHRAHVRVAGSPWFDWAWLGADALPDTAAQAGLATRWVRQQAGRWFAELVKPSAPV
jgi:hypothetical protein